MRQFQISENCFGPETWSVDEIIAGHCWRVADVKAWKIERGQVYANGLGFIKVEASHVQVAGGVARFL